MGIITVIGIFLIMDSVCGQSCVNLQNYTYFQCLARSAESLCNTTDYEKSAAGGAFYLCKKIIDAEMKFDDQVGT